MDDLLKFLGERIRSLRKVQGWSQEMLGEKTGLDPVSIGRIERGTMNPSVLTLQKIALALDVSLCEFFPHGKEIKGDGDKLIEEIVGLLKRKNLKTIELVVRLTREIVK